MNCAWLTSIVLRAASLLAPADQRAEWLNDWRSELWYVPENQSTRFCVGSFSDALWLRRNNLEARPCLESPFRCLGALAALAVMCLLASALLETIVPFRDDRSSVMDGLSAILVSYVLLGTVAVMSSCRWTDRPFMPGRPNVRSSLFLVAKLALLLPVLCCTLLAATAVRVPVFAFALYGGYMMLFRGAFTDQRNRCPVCLRRLTHPVRIGTPSQTFLEWYGAESMCTRGHGFMHAAESLASYAGGQQWIPLDSSWIELFSDSGGSRQR